ncbi:hypothetical protein ACIBJF_44960 [Streptomyces sp. NPDC050743]|uniref:hypothetical protein n=1 Tax=Streptomyces sp. NPDC050743 TaxID=3365634 RepID=UPI00378D7B0A
MCRPLQSRGPLLGDRDDSVLARQTGGPVTGDRGGNGCCWSAQLGPAHGGQDVPPCVAPARASDGQEDRPQQRGLPHRVVGGPHAAHAAGQEQRGDLESARGSLGDVQDAGDD